MRTWWQSAASSKSSHTSMDGRGDRPSSSTPPMTPAARSRAICPSAALAASSPIAETSEGPEADKQSLHQVEVVLDGLCRLAAERQLEFEIQLGPESVGTVDARGLDSSLSEGLLAPWRVGLK